LATYIFELTIPSSASVSKSSSTDPVPSTKPSTIQKYNVQLCKVISEFEFGNTIAMDWSPHQSNQLAIANSKNQINIYSIQFESPPPIGTRKVEMQQSAGPFSEQLQRAKPRVFSRDIDAVMSDVDRAVTGGKGDSNRISGTGSSGDYEIILTIKSAEPAEWIAYAPLNHLLFAFSDRKSKFQHL
jgi:hypothetical protein